ncbi:MAG: Sapep family Mn(2+)-dependent dipeptidase [Ruthenibacterium sp.]
MSELNLTNRIDAFIEANKDAILRDIKTLVDIDSVEAAALPGKPFGAGVDAALCAALSMAQSMGLDAKNLDGYFGYADLTGASETQIATIAHLDVVPQGNGWTQDPFCMERRDGYLIGRGVADDKGPAVLTLYAAKFLKESGETLPYTLRVMFGTNEETGMKGLTYYKSKFDDPAFCFTPDGSFPVCYGEKGIFTGTFHSQKLKGNLVDFEGGIASNVIPDRAFALVRADSSALKNAENITVTAENNLVRIAAVGIGGHAAHPAGTVNAIGLVVNYLLDNALCSADETEYLSMLRDVFASTDGSTLGIAADDGVFDPLTCIGGTMEMKDGVLSQGINVRFPTSIDAQKMTEILSKKAALANAVFVPSERVNTPFYIDPKQPVIQTLIDTYNEVTGKQAKPFTMGGGTYARDFQCAVSFGMEEENEPVPAWVGPMHGADEGVAEALLWRSLKIYILAILRLMKLPF